MKVVILAGGFGTRISEESHLKPKPMLEIGGKPILWHIMKEYSYYGFHDFIICCGYKQHVIKEWFADYYLHNSDVTFDFRNHNEMTVHNNVAEPWKVTLVDTGLHTMTGGELPAMVMIDAIARMVPGVLSNKDSGETESFSNHLLEYPQYSRPAVWHEKSVPEILLSGDHKKVDEWRLEQSIKRTKEIRPDLYEKWVLENQEAGLVLRHVKEN